MASYEAVIKLIVQGEEALKRIQERVDKLYKTIDDLESKKKYAGSEAAAKYVREQANELERVVAVSKQLIQQDERRIIQQSKLNAAVDLYERRLQQTVNSGAAGLKKFQSQIADIQTAFAYFKDKGNVQAVQALATELGRMVEYSNNVSRNERARVANQSKVFEYVKQINAYEEKGLNVAKAREKLAQFTEVAGSNQLNTAKKYAEAIERQLSLLKEQEQLQRRVAAETASLQGGLEKLLQKQAALENSKLDQKALQIQQALDREAAAAAETAAQTAKLNARQTEFIERTNAAAQAAARQTAEFYRLQRIKKELSKIDAPASQLLLPPAAPGSPAMSGGARSLITGPVERLGGARTADEAAMALRYVENIPQQAQGLPRPPTATPKKPPALLQKPGVADALIGGSFPLLFGGGAGATIGGAAGGFIGGAMGGPLGMALSLGLSAVGQQLDAAIAKVGEMQKAINTLNVDALRDSFIYVNAELDGTIRRLIEAGKYDEARAVAAQAATLQTGALGDSIANSAQASSRLTSSWTELVGTVSTSVALLSTDFVNALAASLEVINLVVKGWNVIGTSIGTAVSYVLDKFIPGLGTVKAVIDFINKTLGRTSEEQERLKSVAEAQVEAYARQVDLTVLLNSLDKQRTTNASLKGKLINIEVDRQSKLAQIEAEANEKRRQFNTDNKNATAATRAEFEKQLEKEKQSNIEAANRVALRQRELAITQEILARDQQRISLFQLEAQVVAARGQAAQQITQAQLQQLELQRNAAGSLQQELGIINQIAAAKKTAAQQAYEAAVREQTVAVNTAALELEKVKNQNARIGGMQREVELATAQYNTAIQVRDAVVAGAAATERAAIATADMEQRMATLAAYTQEYARQTQMAQSYLDLQLTTVNNMEKITTSVAGAYIQINNATISTLLAQLQTNISTQQRYDILLRIRDLEIANAGYALKAAVAQIRAEVQRAVIAAQTAELKVQEYKAVLSMAQAQGLANREHYTALKLAETAKSIAVQNVQAANAIASAQIDAANAVYNAAVSAANMKYETEKAAVAAGKYSNAMNSVSGGPGKSIKRDKTTRNIVVKAPSLPSIQTMADMNAANKQAEASLLSPQEPYSPFSSTSEYGSTKSGSNDTNINITTGPVVEFDGTKYVTLADLEAAMRTTVNGIVGTLRTPAARNALGMV